MRICLAQRGGATKGSTGVQKDWSLIIDVE